MKVAFDAKASKRNKDINGFLHVELSPITKECVNPYRGCEITGWQELKLNPEEVYLAYRPAEELEKAAKSFNGLPVLLEHHEDTAEEPQKEHRVGSTGTDTVFKAPYLLSTLSITDAKAIELIENGSFEELSCGYMYDADFTPGSFKGTAYDFVIRNIRGNHVALVEQGRAGRDVKVADSALNINKNKGDKIFMGKVASIFKSLLKTTGKARDGAAFNIDEEMVKIVEAADEEAQPLIAEAFTKLKEVLADSQENAQDEDKQTEENEAQDDAEPAQDEEKKAEDSKEEAKDSEEEKAEDEAVVLTPEVEEKIIKKVADSLAAKDAALTTCQPIIGTNINKQAFDSAEAVYAKALDVAGIDRKGYPKVAYKGMVAAFTKSLNTTFTSTANDSAVEKRGELAKVLAGLNNIDKQ